MNLLERWDERRRRAAAWRVVRQVAEAEAQVRSEPDDGLRRRVGALRERRRRGVSFGALRAEMFALVREACRRAIGIRPYDVQVAAGAALSEGCVIEMETGEGKTFVAPFAACLWALDGHGVHVLTANDYLVERDARTLGPAYALLGFRAAHVLCDMGVAERETAYRADVTYVTVAELGHDYLRQHLSQSPEVLRQTDFWGYLRSDLGGSPREDRCLRGRRFAVLDEADSVLIDFARRPIAVSVASRVQRPDEVYQTVRRFARTLVEGEDYRLDRMGQAVELTDRGERRVEAAAAEHGFVALTRSEWIERTREALAAEHLYRAGKDYVLRDGEVVLVDPVSGRLMPGRRLGGELHQALEAKEGVPIRPRQERVRTITIQSLIRPYGLLGGMTATAWPARAEFLQVYDMPTVRFAPRVALRRLDEPDLFFPDAEARAARLCEDAAAAASRGQPVLIGAWSVERSQDIGRRLAARGVEHAVLNAVDHRNEATIIARAGEAGRVTVATNMAGRGVEIPLGDGVAEVGGLAVLGVERHALSRFDRQLAGRCARRGAPGRARFYLSLEDEVFRALSPGERRRAERRLRGKTSGTTSEALSRLVAACQERFQRHFASDRRRLLVRDLVTETAERRLFGQDRL